MATVVEHRYAPRGTARELFTCHASEVLIGGPAGTGKSRGALEKMLAVALKYPGMRGLFCRKTLASLGNTALVTWREHVAKEHLDNGVCWFYGGSTQQAPGYVFNNGSFIAIGGLDKPSKIMSSEYDIAYVQEATELTKEDWEAITTRLRNGVMPYQQLLADCNPDSEHHWLYLRCLDGATKLLYSRHEDNPRYFDAAGQVTPQGADYMAKLDALTGVRRLRLRDGMWVSAEGAIYGAEWQPAIHIIDEMPRGWETWTRWWSVDFGYANPFVLQCWAEDHDGRLYLYREMYHTERLVEDHARQILAIVAPDDGPWTEPRPQSIICDHDAEDRATLERHLGLSTVAAIKTVSDGIQGVQGRLRTAGDGHPRLFVLRGCTVERDPRLANALKPTSTIEEIPGYIRVKVREGDTIKEEPLKKDDHGCDAMRYMVMHRDWKGDSFFRGWIE